MAKTIKTNKPGGDKGLKPSPPPPKPTIKVPKADPNKHSYQPSSPPPIPIKRPPSK